MYVFRSTSSTDFSLYLTKLKHWTPHRTSMSYSVIACFTCREEKYGVWTGVPNLKDDSTNNLQCVHMGCEPELQKKQVTGET